MAPTVRPKPQKITATEVSSACTSTEAFRALVADGTFFLDSALTMKNDLTRYSFLGCRPFMVLRSKGRDISIQDRNGTVQRHGNPFDQLRRLLAEHRSDDFQLPGIPFTGGAVGYLSYDLCHFVERLPSTTVDDIGFPDMYFGFYDRVLVYDHHENKCLLVGRDVDVEENGDYLAAALRKGAAPTANSFLPEGAHKAEIKSNFTRDAYLDAVRRTKEYIAQGDVYQVNISQRFEAELTVPPHELYMRLRARNPAPFSAYIQFDDKAVVSSSPERFMRLQSGGSGGPDKPCRVQTRPIKGTRPRGKNAAADTDLRQELMNSPKDNAELTMIVDLERNDIGRVCNYGSVRVTSKNFLETHPTVFHLVAAIEGELHPRYDATDLLRATFPGGSITGAPKIRAMEIIDELEPTSRNLYTGTIGYIGFNGNMDLNIAIRTFLLKGSTAYFQAGGGIVADSDPEQEYQETLDKARALMESVA
ncbi:MAG: aminodeoxychorismate synthase component I [Planctomycetes bacterium]|nr:aminodeoxychorismate synthase component I [Planctomycetota bacterium]